MQEQNFEKQVHKLLDDLAIPPSPPVWNKVEEQIRKKNERRRVIFWLLPLILVSTGFLWWMMSSDNKLDQSISSGNTNTDFSQSNTKETESIEKNKFEKNTSSLNDGTNSNTSLSINNKSNIVSNSKTKSKGLIENKNYTKSQRDITTNSETGDTRSIISETESEKTKTTNLIIDQKVLNEMDTFKSETANNIKKDNDQRGVQDSSIKSTEINNNEETIEEEILEEEIVEKKQVVPANLTKWKLVPYLAAGFSSISKGLFEPVASADFAGSPTAGSGSFFPPSVPEKSLYFSAGLRLVKKLNERLEIFTGLQYSYFSTKTYIGTRVINDTIVAYSNTQLRLQDYYQNGNTNKYTNNYHFISMPAAIEYQLLKNVPVSLQAGVSLNQLVYTNALMFNRNSNIQFENNKAWNKTQIHAFSGLQFHFLKNKEFSFKAGPFIQYSLTRLEQDPNRKQFLSVAGFQSQFYFNSKK